MSSRFSWVHAAISTLLLTFLTATTIPAQTAAPQLLPYFTSVVAGGGTTSSFTAGAPCPVSGNTATDKYGDGCLATEVQLNAPAYVTADIQGNVFFSDTNNSLVRRVDATTGVISLIAGGATANPASGGTCGANTSGDWQGDGCLSSLVKLGKPQGIAISPITGDLYFGDTTNASVRKISATNGFVTRPGIISNVAGSVTGTKATYGYTANSSTVQITAATQSILDDPYGVAFDAQGILFIAEEYKDALLAVNTTAATVTVANTTIAPGTIAKIMGYQNATNGTYCPNGTSGTYGCTFGNWVDGAAANLSLTDNPYDLTVDPSGNVYFANNYSTSIAIGKVSTAGTVTTYAGKQALGAVTNTRGAANTIYIGSPYGLTADANGNVYFSDSLKGWIWRVDASNQGLFVLAGAGNPCAGTYGDGCPASETKFSTGTIKTSGSNFYASTAGVSGLYSDKDGTLFVTDAVANMVHKIVTGTNFGTIQLTEPTQTIEVHFGVNDSPAANAFTLTTSPGNFSLSAPSCTTNTDNTTDCTVAITATPTQTASGPFASNLHVVSAQGLAADFPLTGTLQLEQANSTIALSFSATSMNPATAVTVSASVAGASSSTPVNGTVTFYNNGTQIGATQTVSNGTASIQYTFPAGTYSITASYSGSQLLFSSASTSTQIISVIPVFSSIPLQTAVTVVQGQTALNSFTLASAGQYTGNVAFTCSGLPANSSCIVSPSTAVVAPGGTTTVALSILTSGPLTPISSLSTRGTIAFACLPGAGLLLLLARRRRLKLPATLLLIALLFSGSIFVSGCGNGTQQVPTTPTGSSNITVTATGTPNILATGTNIVQTSTIALTVNPQP
jgi:hypothetical protein